MTVNAKDFLAGILFIAFGSTFAINAFFELRIGTPLRMGPGYFPIILGSLLVALGAGISLRALWDRALRIAPLAWRGPLLIGLAPVLFGLTIERLGFLLATALAAAVAAFASQRMGWRRVAATTVAVTFFSYLIFYQGLAIPVSLFGSWIPD